MAEIDVITADISAAGKKMDALASAVGTVKPASDLAGIRGALPDSQTAGAVGSLENAWADRFSTFRTDADDFAVALAQSATTYDQADLDAARRQKALELQTSPVPVSNPGHGRPPV